MQNHTRKDPECHTLSLVWGSAWKDQKVSKKAHCAYPAGNIPARSGVFWKSTRPHSHNSLARNLSAVFHRWSFDDRERLQVEKLVEEVSKHPRFEAVTWISWMIFFRFRLRMVIKAWSKGRENLKIWSWARNVAHSKTKAEGWVPLSPQWVLLWDSGETPR